MVAMREQGWWGRRGHGWWDMSGRVGWEMWMAAMGRRWVVGT